MMMIRMSLILTLAVFLLACGSTDDDDAGTENVTTENAAPDPMADESTDQNQAAQDQWEKMVEESEQADDGT
jgi:PBP1b-binding outer membrane lipoprotein LpoB